MCNTTIMIIFRGLNLFLDQKIAGQLRTNPFGYGLLSFQLIWRGGGGAGGGGS